jgi:hypothetical protein
MQNPIAQLKRADGRGIDVDSMLTIHRGEGAYIGFLRKDPDTGIMESVMGVEAKELKGWLPQLRPYLLEDSYFTVNSSYRAAPFNSKLTGLPSAWRKEKHLKYLNACYVDLDVGRFNSQLPEQRITWSDALSAVIRRTDRGELLPPSMAARSGRGLYLFWMLRHRDNPDQPPGAYIGKEVVIYKAINKVLTQTLNSLAADIHSVDAAKILRVPGSIHRTAQRRVTYIPLLDQNGQAFLYTLEEMADFLGIKTLKSNLPGQTERLLEPGAGRRKRTAPDKKGTAPKRRAGREALNAKRASDLLSVCQYYGGWIEGERWHKLSLYARFILGSGVDFKTTVEAVKQVAVECNPPYPSTYDDWSIADIVLKARDRPLRYTNTRLIKWLRITPRIARELELESILPEEVTRERRALTPTKEQKIQDRRQFIRGYIEAHRQPTCRAMAKILNQNGFNVGKDTVSRDYRAILSK